MTFRVEMSTNAKVDVRNHHRRIAIDAPATADRWVKRLERAIGTLSRNPERCRTAWENDQHPEEIRQLLFGNRRSTYRVLYTIRDDRVAVLHIRPSVMNYATTKELYG